MRVKLLKRWRAHHAGGEMDAPDGFANVLIRRGIAQQIGPPRKKRGVRRSKPYIESCPDP